MEKSSIETIRHSLSHVLATAVKELYPDVKFAIGPAIDSGFYYDFDFGDIKVNDENLKEIEKKMKHLLKQQLQIINYKLQIEEALEKEKKDGQIYKTELIEDLKKQNETEVSYYTFGNFTDLCRGPHVEKLSEINGDAFKLDKVAGAYWRGSEKNKMLTRIYALAFATHEELEQHLKNREEAEKRDHRKIGRELDLFSFHEEAPGMPFFHPKGTIIYEELKNFWIKSQKEFNYDMVLCPCLLDVSVWKKSGHWNHYKDDMYFIKAAKGEKKFALRPMDCPGAIIIYNDSPKSYRDLPRRYAEPGLITRKEKSGQLGGLFRVQQFVQDDAHIFTAPEQIEEEIKNVIALVDKIYRAFDLKYEVFLSTRPDDFMGKADLWDRAEEALKKILKEVYGDNYGLKEKDGAFYGPKIDFQVKDALGRTWQCATIQLDFQMPLKFNCRYVDKNGKEKTPVLIHRTIMGSFERFLGILTEHYAGAFPAWLAPVQVKILSVGETHLDFCQKLADKFRASEIRVEIDTAGETVGNKIRKAVNEKVPYLLVVGDKEIGSDKLAVRERGSRDTYEMSFEELVKIISDSGPKI